MNNSKIYNFEPKKTPTSNNREYEIMHAQLQKSTFLKNSFKIAQKNHITLYLMAKILQKTIPRFTCPYIH